MSTPELHFERRSAQRFDVNVPVRLQKGDVQALGFSQDLSLRGMFLFTELQTQPGDKLEVTLKMPAETTLSEPMNVRCQATVLRVTPQPGSGRFGIAVRLSGHTYSEESAQAPFTVSPASREDTSSQTHGAD